MAKYITSSAVLSDCKKYRYRLVRIWDPKLPVCSFGMINPSTADSKEDDPTIRKCVGFAQRLGFGGMIVWNQFAFITPHVKELKLTEDPVGELNDIYILAILQLSAKNFVAWGPEEKVHNSLRFRFEETHKIIQFARVTPYAIGLTKWGYPRHPLMTPYDTEISTYVRPND